MGLAFRSWAGVLLAATVIPLVPARINPQQVLLRTQFGAGDDAYGAHNYGCVF
jgi:hypothetical protein